MKLTKDLENIIQHYLEILKNQQQFTSFDRYNIYQAFGYSKLAEGTSPALAEEEGKGDILLGNFSFADYTLCWLAIITVQYVLSAWEPNKFDSISHGSDEDNLITPHLILQTMESLLNRKISVKDAFLLYHNDFHDGIDKFMNDINYNSQCVYWAAYKAIQIPLYGRSNNYIDNNYNGEEVDKSIKDLGLKVKSSTRDEIKEEVDFTTNAMLAYAAIDKNQPGDWQHIKGYVNLFTMRTVYRKANLQDIEISQGKRLEFWEWWLTEAIPQAWELAQ